MGEGKKKRSRWKKAAAADVQNSRRIMKNNADRLVLPHLVSNEQRRDEERPTVSRIEDTSIRQKNEICEWHSIDANQDPETISATEQRGETGRGGRVDNTKEY